MSSRATGILRKKPIEQISDESGEGLERSLGLWQLTAIGVGGIIGAGIFSLAGAVASGGEGGKGVGPAVVISFLIAGVASAAAAFSYAEFAGLIPRAGSAYTYGYAVLGELVGWCIGWDLLLEYIAIVAVVAIGSPATSPSCSTRWGWSCLRGCSGRRARARATASTSSR